MDWLDEFPTMERQELRDMKKAIDLGFRDFSRAYGEGLENFFHIINFRIVTDVAAQQRFVATAPPLYTAPRVSTDAAVTGDTALTLTTNAASTNTACTTAIYGWHFLGFS